MKVKAKKKSDFMLKTVKQKGKKIELDAHNKAYSIKKVEKRQKVAEKSKKALERKKEAEAKRVKKLEEKERAEEKKTKRAIRAKIAKTDGSGYVAPAPDFNIDKAE